MRQIGLFIHEDGDLMIPTDLEEGDIVLLEELDGNTCLSVIRDHRSLYWHAMLTDNGDSKYLMTMKLYCKGVADSIVGLLALIHGLEYHTVEGSKPKGPFIYRLKLKC